MLIYLYLRRKSKKLSQNEFRIFIFTRFGSDKDKKTLFLNRTIQYTELTMQDPKNIRVLPELEISKKVLEDYKDKHVLHCTKEQMDKYYSTFINLL